MMRIEPAASEAERAACARIMAGSDPWLTLGLGYDYGLAIVSQLDREVYVAKEHDEVAGFVVVAMTGVLAGYLQTIAVDARFRGQGVGTQLIAFVEERVWRERPNVFLFVSSFNTGARELYERLGYRAIGEVENFLAAGYGEILMRKTIGPLRGFQPRS